MKYKALFAVEIYDIILETQNRVCFERLMQEFDTLFDYTSPKVPTLKLLNISIIQRKYGIIIDQIYHTMKNII